MAAFNILITEHFEVIYVSTVCQGLCYRLYLYPVNLHGKPMRYYLLLCLAKFKLGWMRHSGGSQECCRASDPTRCVWTRVPSAHPVDTTYIHLCIRNVWGCPWVLLLLQISLENTSLSCPAVGPAAKDKWAPGDARGQGSSGHSVTSTTREGTPG